MENPHYSEVYIDGISNQPLTQSCPTIITSTIRDPRIEWKSSAGHGQLSMKDLSKRQQLNGSGVQWVDDQLRRPHVVDLGCFLGPGNNLWKSVKITSSLRNSNKCESLHEYLDYSTSWDLTWSDIRVLNHWIGL